MKVAIGGVHPAGILRLACSYTNGRIAQRARRRRQRPWRAQRKVGQAPAGCSSLKDPSATTMRWAVSSGSITSLSARRGKLMATSSGTANPKIGVN